MDLEIALHSRRTAHEFIAEAAPSGLLEALVEAGHQAPCHKLTWPWRFRSLGPDTRAALVPLALALKAGKAGRPLVGPLAAKVAAVWTSPMLVIAVTQVLADDPLRREEDYAAVACAIQNMQLLATGRGLGAKWSTSPLCRHSDALALLDVNPEQERCVGFVFVGRPARLGTVERPPALGLLRAMP